jgi:hypothetical protein
MHARAAGLIEESGSTPPSTARMLSAWSGNPAKNEGGGDIAYFASRGSITFASSSLPGPR